MAAPAAGQRITAAMLGQIPQNCTQKVGAAQTTSLITLSGSAQDLTGTSLTFSVAYACTIMVFGCFDFDSSGSTSTAVGTCVVDGSTQQGEAHLTGLRGTEFQEWLVALTAGSHTIKLQALKSGGSDTMHTNAIHTKWHAWVPSP